MSERCVRLVRRVRWALRFATILLLTAVTAVTATAAFAKWDWRADLLTHFVPLWFIGAFVAFTLAALAGARKTAIIALLVTLIHAFALVPWYLPPRWLTAGEATKEDGNLRLLFANVNFMNQDHRPVLKMIAEDEPDIIVLQEVTLAWEKALAPLEDHYPHRFVHPRRNPGGLGVWSKVAFDQTGLTPYPNLRGWPILQVAFQWRGTPVTLLSAHPFPPLPAGGARANRTQFRLIEDRIRAIQGPLILAADLNSTMWSPEYAQMRKTGLDSTRRGYGIQGTWYQHHAHLWLPIDHVLVSTEFRTQHFRVGRPIGSDHRPLIVDLRLK